VKTPRVYLTGKDNLDPATITLAFASDQARPFWTDANPGSGLLHQVVDEMVVELRKTKANVGL
jgi:hypothetical protein